MAVYGVTSYGAAPPDGYYGAALPQYIVDPFIASPVSYESIMLTWQKPGGTIQEFRLLRNRAGYPVDENDGEILIDSATFPGTSYLDTNVIPGTYHYYGIYVLITEGLLYAWIRAGVTACLMPKSYGSGSWLYGLLPEIYQKNLGGSLTQDAAGNIYLQQFLNVIGWGLDYLKTQYELLLSANDPAAIPIGSLMNLATELGLPFYSDVSMSVMQQMVASAAHINRERGSFLGIANEITQLTGWGADIQISRNIMLEQDQSLFLDPVYPAWYSNTAYHLGERVTYSNYIYQNLIEGTIGIAPTGLGTSNANWQVVLSSPNNPSLWNPATGWRSTWEARYPAATNSAATSGGCYVQAVVSEGTTPPATALLYLQRVTLINPQHQAFNTNPAFSPTVLPWTVTGGTLTLAQLSGYAGTPAVLTPSGSASQAFISSELEPCASGAGIQVAALVYSPTGYSNAFVSLNWYDSGKNLLSTSSGGGTAIPANTWTTLTFSANAPFGALQEVVGIQDPVTTTSFASNGLQVTNTSGSAQAVELRTLARTQADMQRGNAYPDPAQVIGDGIPIPWTPGFEQWEPTTEYGTGQLVWYGGQPFISLKASLNIVPALNTNTPTNEWAPLGFDQRIMLMWSAYQMQTGGTVTTATPYAVWYDQWGNRIASVTARNNGTPGNPPNNLIYDSFSGGWGASINGRSPDLGGLTWTTGAGSLTVDGFAGGAAHPGVPTTRSYAVINSGVANTMLGLTMQTAPAAGYSCGLVARWSNDTNYWRIDQNFITTVVAGSKTHAATHSTAFSPGDRMTVSLNGNVVTVYRNNGTTAVSTFTSSFNSTATSHGIISELT